MTPARRGRWTWRNAQQANNPRSPKIEEAARLGLQARACAVIVYGQNDALVPVDDSIQALSQVLEGNGVAFTALIVPRAEHNLTVHPQAGKRFFFWHAAPGYIDTMAAWAKSTAEGLAHEPSPRPR